MNLSFSNSLYLCDLGVDKTLFILEELIPTSSKQTKIEKRATCLHTCCGGVHFSRLFCFWQTIGLNTLSILLILFILKRESPFSHNAGDDCYADNKLKITMVDMDKMVAMTRIE